MESQAVDKGRRRTSLSGGIRGVVFDRECVRIEANGSEDASKAAPKNKKNVTINVDLLKAAFLALGQFGPNESGEDEQDQELTLSFGNVSYSVKRGIKRESKFILNGVHGEFRPGELTAVIGPSGSGKTSLLNILAGFTTAGVSGYIKVNGKERDLTTFARKSCYIMQYDEMSQLLTAEEAMTMAANLKLAPKVAGKKKTVMKILESLGLLECRQVLAGNLSGGQRKRLSIALELISNPPVLFLDEPTSGLDSSSSKQCVTLLKDLARSGRTIICTLHQPSASLFEMIDHLYVLQNGHCLYSGGSEKLLSFLADHDLQCPQHYNPADYVLEVATMTEYKQQVPKLIKEMKNGRCRKWRTSLTESNENGSPQEKAEQTEEAVPAEQQTGAVPTAKDVKAPPARCTQHIYPASFWRQFCIILMRNFRTISRNAFFTKLQFLVHVTCGIFIGLLFYDVGDDAAYLLDNFGLHFFCLMWNMFTSYSSAVSFYPEERPTLAREHFNKWYSLRAYFLATNLANLPVQIVCAMLFTGTSYFLTSQPTQLDRFFKFSLITLSVVLVGQSFGYLVGSAMSVQNAAVFGALLIAPFLLFSGYFVLLADSPESLKWLFHISYYKYALEGVMDAIFGNNREKLKCSEDYCHYKVPRAFLKRLGMDCVDYWLDVSFLLGLSVILRVLSYFILRFRLNYFRC